MLFAVRPRMKTEKGQLEENLSTGRRINNGSLEKKAIGRNGFPFRGQRVDCPLTQAQTADILDPCWITERSRVVIPKPLYFITDAELIYGQFRISFLFHACYSGQRKCFHWRFMLQIGSARTKKQGVLNKNASRGKMNQFNA